MFDSLKKLFYKAGLYLPGGEQRLIRHLKVSGANIGNDIKVYGASSVVIDETRPWLLTIGNHVRITHGVTILTHDYSKCVLNQKYGNNIGEGRETVIGDNVFIGMNSVILMGTHIGDNVIIGAGSIVHGNIPDDVVIGGNPARIICTLEEHQNKRIQNTASEAVEVARSYRKTYGKDPSQYEMRAFKTLYDGSNRTIQKWEDYTAFMEEVHKSI